MGWLRNSWIRWFGSGLLLGVGFVVPALWIAGIAGALLFVQMAEQDISLIRKVLGAWLAWSSKAAIAVSSLWDTYPIEWLAAEIGSVQLLLIFSSWIITALCLGSGAAVLVIVLSVFTRNRVLPAWARYFILYPFIWLCAELIGSLLYSVAFYGPGGAITTAFSFGYVGYLLAEHEGLLQAARFAGVYGLTILFMLLVGWLAVLGVPKLVRYWPVVLITGGLLYISGFVTWYQYPIQTTAGQSVVIVDTHFTSTLANTDVGQVRRSDSLAAAVATALEGEPDYIILPEDSRFFDQRIVTQTKAKFKTQYGAPSTVLIDSGRVQYGEQTVLQAYVYNGVTDGIERFHKRYLVPQGEFVPYLYEQILVALGHQAFYEFYTRGISYEVGPRTNQSIAAANVPGILFCFESVDPQGVRRLAKERPDMPFVAHIVSHAWFHEPFTFWSQMDTFLRVQAVWNQQYVVSAGNMVAGKVFAPNGAILEPDVIASGDLWEIKRVVIPKVSDLSRGG